MLRQVSGSNKLLDVSEWQLGTLLSGPKAKIDYYHTKIKLECFSFKKKKKKRVLEREVYFFSAHSLPFRSGV